VGGQLSSYRVRSEESRSAGALLAGEGLNLICEFTQAQRAPKYVQIPPYADIRPGAPLREKKP
jgi:hypothetical protein